MGRLALLLIVALLWLQASSDRVLNGQIGKQSQPVTPPSANPTASPANSQNRAMAQLTVRTNLVLVPVVVTKSGEHVLGLQKEAFRVEENGKARSISVFAEMKTEKLTAPGNAKIESHSNFISGDEQNLRLTAIVLDMVNTPWIRQMDAKRQLTSFLLHTALQGEPVGIFGLNQTGLHQLHPFTSDTKVLIEALQKLKLSLSLEESTQAPEQLTDDPAEQQEAADEAQVMSDFMQDLTDTVAANYQRMAIQQTLRGMKQLANALQAVPGRKSLIWASAGFPFTIDDPQSFGRQGDDMKTEYEDTWRALNSANIAVYPVDLSAMDFSSRSLPSANTGTSSRQINNIRGVNGTKSALRLPYDKSVQQMLTLHAFADATGGRACITVEELDKCFAEAVDDSRAYYLLGYYLEPNAEPGWRKLKVAVEGKGLRVRYRSGFYVVPQAADSTDLRRQQFVDALASPVEFTGLRLTVQLMKSSSADRPTSPGTGLKRTAEFMLGVMGDSLTIDRNRGNAVDLEIVTLVFDRYRRSISNNAQVIATQIKQDNPQVTLHTGIGIPEKVELPLDGEFEVKFAVRDNLSGRLGTVSYRIN